MNHDQMDFEPVPAEGVGHGMFSLPELFYLTHQELIEEWAGLKRTATSARDNWLREHVAPAIAAIAEQRMLGYAFVGEGRWQSALIVLPDTPYRGERPVLGLGLCWSATDLSAPFVCLAVDGTNELGSAAREAALSNGGREVRVANRFKHEQTWPAWRYVNLPAHWWNDLDAALELLCNEVTATFDLFEQPLRAGVEAARVAAP